MWLRVHHLQLRQGMMIIFMRILYLYMAPSLFLGRGLEAASFSAAKKDDTVRRISQVGVVEGLQ
jgi:hypothetical protein